MSGDRPGDTDSYSRIPLVATIGVAFPHPAVSIRKVRLPKSRLLEVRKITFLALPRNVLVEFVQRFTRVAVPHHEGKGVERPVFATIVGVFRSHRPCRYQSCYGAVPEAFLHPAENKCLGKQEQMFGMMRTE